MSLIDGAVITKLKASPAVTSLVSSRIYPDRLPPNPTLPAITVLKISDVPDPVVPSARFARVQCSCWSDPPAANGVRSPAEVERLSGAVGSAVHVAQLNMSPTAWTVGTASYSVTKTRVQNAPRMIEDGSGYYHVPVDVVVEFTES